MSRLTLAAGLILLTSAAHAQNAGQQVTQPSETQNQSQSQTNMAQQPANARQAGTGQAQNQQVTQPSETQNQSQAQQNQGQQPANARPAR